MKILVTNDDGINALGIEVLIKKAKNYGDIIISAPTYEQSAASHAIMIKDGIKVEVIEAKKYSVASTPADCVRYVNFHTKDEYDIVFSGINNGYNIGEDILYSGTVAAATEAVLLGKKAIAFSTKRHDFTHVEKHFDEIMKYIFNNKLLDIWPLYNVNVPPFPKGIKITKQGNTNFNTLFRENVNVYYQEGKPDFSKDVDEETDVNTIYNGYISITPLAYDRTNFEIYYNLKNKK